MRTVPSFALPLLGAALLAAACGGPSNTASSSPSPTTSSQHIASVDACTLVTAAEASAAVGSAVMNVAATSGVQIPGACIYGSSESSAGVFVYAQVYPDTTTADAVQPDQIATILAGQLGVANAHSVSGIGDKAFEYTATGSGENGIAIFVFKANVVMMIVVNPTTNSASVEQLARTAVSRLKAG